MLFRLTTLTLSLALLIPVGCYRSGIDPLTGLPYAARVDLSGRGASFVDPIMQFWINEYIEETDGRIRINYQPSGSGDGIAKFSDGLIDFGCSDAPMNRQQLEYATAHGGSVIHIPLVIGAVVPMYHLEGVDETVNFSGPVLADIFRGKITNWSDQRIQALNPNIDFPDRKILPVYRSDPSGTTFIFVDYLAKVSDEFRKEVGVSNDPNWPNGIGTRQPKNDGVACHIARTPGAIGYVELTYALDTKCQYGAVQNRSGRMVLADLPSITAAAEASMSQKGTEEPYSLHELTYSLTDSDGEYAYPIAGMSYALLRQQMPHKQGKAMVSFFQWCMGDDGQKMASVRNYAPLPVALRSRVVELLNTIETEK